MRNLLWKSGLAIMAGGLLGIWACWQDVQDDHLINMYDCAHRYAVVHLDESLEQAWIACEKAAR